MAFNLFYLRIFLHHSPDTTTISRSINQFCLRDITISYNISYNMYKNGSVNAECVRV